MKRWGETFLCSILLVGLLSFGDVWAGDGASAAAQDNAWQPLAGPTGGAVSALAMSPDYAADHTVFAGLRGGGVYRTTDWGGSWQRLSADPWIVVDLAISPAYRDDTTVLATQGTWTAGYNVFRSSDAGETWSDVSPTWADLPAPPLLSISPDFAADGTVYVLGGLHTYVSTDGGQTFLQAAGWFEDHAVAELAFSPVYSEDLTLFAIVPGDGLYKSTDGGSAWVPTGLSGDLGSVAVSPDYAADRMLLATSATDGQLQASTDGGATWSPGSLSLGTGGRHTLAFSPSFGPGDRVILAASSADPGPYRSEDGGATWAPADWHNPADTYPQGFVGGGVYALALSPAGIWDPAAYAGTSSGIYRSFNRGVDWFQRNDGLPRLTVPALAIAPGAPEVWLAGTRYFDHQRFDASVVGEYDGNLQLSVDGGQTWHDVSGRLDRVNAVAFSPAYADDETAFATAGTIGQHGFYDGGVYRSTDGGYNWDEVLADRIYEGLAISPDFALDRTVWTSAWTGSEALGIYASYDGGEVWIPLAAEVHAERIVPSPEYARDRTLFAGTGDAGLQRSTDAGVSWSQVLSPSITALALSPAFGTGRTLYAAGRQDPSAPCEIYRSADGGDNWQLLDTGIPAWAGDVPLTVSALAFAADGSVLAGVYYGREMEGGAVYRSVDGGETWKMPGFLPPHNNVLALASRPAGSLALYAGTSDGVYHLDVAQGGPAEPGTWTSNGPRGGRADALAVSPTFAADGLVLAGEGTMGRFGTAWGLGVLRSPDGAQTWSPTSLDASSGGSTSAIYDLAFSPTYATDGTAFAGTWGGLFRSTDGGRNWQQVTGAFFGPPGSITEVAVAPDYAASGHLMGGSAWGGLYVSRDFGRTWAVDYELGVVDEIAYSPAFAADATAFASAYPGGEGQLLRTTDGALTWAPVLSHSVCSLALSPQFESDGTIYAGSDGLYVSHDWGTTWISLTLPAGASGACPLAISPAFGTDATLFIGTGGGLYRTGDGGATWSHVAGYTGPAIRSLVVSPGWPAHPVLLAGGARGVYRSADGGANWSLTPGMTALPAEPLAGAADPRSLLAGTYLHGVYASHDAGGSWLPYGLQEWGISRLVDVAIAPGWPAVGTVFAALANTQSIGASIHRTADGGATWEQVLGGQYVYRNALALSPQFRTDGTVYAAIGGQVYGSHDGGASWATVGEWPAGAYQVARQLLLTPDGSLLAAGDGLWRLPPGATTWQAASSGPVMDGSVSSLALSPGYVGDGTLLATIGWDEPQAGRRFDLLRSVDGGVHWQAHSTGLPDAEMGYLAFSPRFALDATAYLAVGPRLYRSLNGGLSWTDVGPAPGAAQLYEMLVDGEGDLFVAAGAGLSGAGNGVWHYATPAYDVVVDGGFEVDSGWELPLTAQPAGYSQRVVYDGARSMRVGADDAGETAASYSSARQVVSIPADALTATLRCHVYPVSGEATPAEQARVLALDSAAGGDAQYLLLLDPETGKTLDVLFWQLSNTQAWQAYAFDLI
ncbi:MAG: hypothetical protein P8129_07425, partial [Anaerolineae bacterium]